jgi:hypothetical protein
MGDGTLGYREALISGALVKETVPRFWIHSKPATCSTNSPKVLQNKAKDDLHKSGCVIPGKMPKRLLTTSTINTKQSNPKLPYLPGNRLGVLLTFMIFRAEY